MAVEIASVILTLLVVGHATSGQATETSEGNSGKELYACARNFLADLYAYCGSEHVRFFWHSLYGYLDGQIVNNK